MERRKVMYAGALSGLSPCFIPLADCLPISQWTARRMGTRRTRVGKGYPVPAYLADLFEMPEEWKGTPQDAGDVEGSMRLAVKPYVKSNSLPFAETFSSSG
jgi:hypothetical protein